MYSYSDVEKIKNNLQWIIHQATAGYHLPATSDQQAIQLLHELIHGYEKLLESISEFGVSVIDKNVEEGLNLTENFIAEIKLKMEAM